MSDDHHPRASEGSGDAHAGKVCQQPGARPPEPEEPAAAASEIGRRRAENWFTQENRHLRIRVEDLEGRLRRKTFALMGALVAAGLLAATAAALAVAPLRGPEAPEEAPLAVEGGRAELTLAAGHEVGGAALRAALERIAELEVAGARDEATIAELRAELEGARAEARARGLLLERSRQGIQEFNALLAAMLAGDGGRGDGGEGRQAGPHEAGGPSRP